MDSHLPPVRLGSRVVAVLASAVVADIAALFIPGTNTLREIYLRVIDSRIRAAWQIISERLEEEGLEVLAEKDIEEFVPALFRYFQLARDGEARRILKILARYVAREAKDESLNSNMFLAIARQFEGLGEAEIILLAEAYVFQEKTGETRPDIYRKSEDTILAKLISKLVPHSFKSEAHLRTSASLLSGRGLVFPEAGSIEGPDDIRVAPSFAEIFEKLEREFESGSQ